MCGADTLKNKRFKANTPFAILEGIMKFLLISVLTSLAVVHSNAQEQFNRRPSPMAVASLRYKDTYLKITYSQPQKRGRAIFGQLVPYGAVWRTGANEATDLTITRDVFINNQLLSAGTYSVFTIPDADKWTIIINKDVGLWGAYNYNADQDVLRFEAPVEQLDAMVYEAFIITLEQKLNQAIGSFLWDNVKVSFPIVFVEPKP